MYSGSSGQNRQTEEEAGGASRLSRHAELRGDAVDQDETEAAAALLSTSSEEVLNIFFSAVRNGEGVGGWGFDRSPATVQSAGSG